ncbi:primosomal protein N' (replication factor Y) - superfamily II helicase (plasmid) [Vibrio coralliilyticus]|uniref:hypothetical protein n=1 Tax=Vibrio coralliilyticus TaxID=190893 RepID=UPI0005F9C072|nr:hypothetical protein [Vibrio coralliilyticus]QOU33206.1 primosomal protein N' (replication factor Y) - superfamily II helicase [Vibrio coralliilyticus]
MLIDTKCSNCSASLTYLPGARSLTCETCETSFDIAPAQDTTNVFKESELLSYLEAFEQTQEHIEVSTIECDSCGATAEFGANIKATHCAFCDTPLVVDKAQNRNRIKPQGMIPFLINRQRAIQHFNSWIGCRWLAPNALKKHAQHYEHFQGVYLPYWTYDCDVATDYRGERGYERKRKSSSGHTKIDVKWKKVTGSVATSFDDVMVPGSTSLPDKLLNRLEPWDLDALEAYADEYFIGYQAETYQIDIKQGFEDAKDRMQFDINALIRKDIGGARQFIAATDSTYSNAFFKHITLPIWVTSYRYKDKVYQVLVNGQTGKVHGTYPVSKVKLTLFQILVALAALGITILTKDT